MTDERTKDELRLEIESKLNEMVGWYVMYMREEQRIKETHSFEFNSIPQNGVVYLESQKQTHFILPTSVVDKSLQPWEYVHKVVVYNLKSNLFDTMYEGTAHRCLQYVFEWQAQTYGINTNARIKALNWLDKTKKFFEWAADLFDEDYSKSIQDRIFAAQKEAQNCLNIVPENEQPQVDLEAVKQESQLRGMVRQQRREQYQSEKLSVSTKTVQ